MVGLLGVGLLVGCAPGLDDPDAFLVEDCPEDVPALLRRSCGLSNCHAAYESTYGLDLQSGNVAERLVGIEASSCSGHALIDPQNPSQSFLLERLSEEPDCDGMMVGRMPQGGSLTPEQIACVAAWVEEVAAEYPDRTAPVARDAGAAPTDAGDAADAGPGAGDAG